MPVGPQPAEDDVLREDSRCRYEPCKQEAKKDPGTAEEDVQGSVGTAGRGWMGRVSGEW